MSLRSKSLSLGRSAAIAALIGGALSIGPLTSAGANPAGSSNQWAYEAATLNAAQVKATSASKTETVEQRITTLHNQLKITSAEEQNWGAVAQAMRDNAANMQKLVDEKKSQPSGSVTALDDLTTYQNFAQAHLDGLKNLTTAFQTLYNGMPDSQKKIADNVFRNFGRKQPHAAAHG